MTTSEVLLLALAGAIRPGEWRGGEGDPNPDGGQSDLRQRREWRPRTGDRRDGTGHTDTGIGTGTFTPHSLYDIYL